MFAKTRELKLKFVFLLASFSSFALISSKSLIGQEYLHTYLCSDVSQGGCTILNSALTDGISILPTIYVANIVSQTLTSCYGSSRFVM